jgi:hypothetical protein
MSCNKSLNDEWTDICNDCRNGICRVCAEKIRIEKMELYNILSKECNFCTSTYDDYCKECKSHYVRILDNIKQRNNVYDLKLYKIASVNDITHEMVRDQVFGKDERCECNPLCKCSNNAKKTIKEKRKLENLVLYEVYDEPSDYCIYKCDKCCKLYNDSLAANSPNRINIDELRPVF